MIRDGRKILIDGPTFLLTLMIQNLHLLNGNVSFRVLHLNRWPHPLGLGFHVHSRCSSWYSHWSILTSYDLLSASLEFSPAVGWWPCFFAQSISLPNIVRSREIGILLMLFVLIPSQVLFHHSDFQSSFCTLWANSLVSGSQNATNHHLRSPPTLTLAKTVFSHSPYSQFGLELEEEVTRTSRCAYCLTFKFKF